VVNCIETQIHWNCHVIPTQDKKLCNYGQTSSAKVFEFKASFWRQSVKVNIKPTTTNLTFTCPCIASISLKYNQNDATFSRSIYLYKLLYMLQAVPPPIIRSTKLYIQRQVFSNQYCCLLLSWMRWNAVPSHIAAGSSIGLKIPDAVCTVLCSWWWAEEPPEACRATYMSRNSYCMCCILFHIFHLGSRCLFSAPVADILCCWLWMLFLCWCF